jgi:hypothetical protein
MFLPLRVSAKELESAREHVLDEAVQFASRLGCVSIHEEAGALGLSCSFEDWVRLAGATDLIGDPDERDELEELIAELDRRLTAQAVALDVRLSGLVARNGSQIQARLADSLVTWSDDLSWPCVGSLPIECGPSLASLLSAVFDYNRASDDGERRRAALALTRRRHRFERALAGRGCTIGFDPALEIKGVARARKLQVRVDEAVSGQGRVSVTSQVTVEDGRTIEVSSRTLDRTGAFLQVSATEFVELSDPMREAMAALRPWKGVEPSVLEARGALNDPQFLLNEDVLEVAGDSFEFVGYSDRVIGFRPVDPSELARPRESSGIQWFADDGATHPSLFAHFTQRDETGAVVGAIELDTRETAESLLASCTVAEVSAESPNPGPPLAFEGTAIQNPSALASAIREVLRKDDEQKDREHREPANRRRGGSLVADLRDAETAEEPTRLRATEPDWVLLESLLAENVSLLPHQREGIRWMWSRYVHALEQNDTSAGCLLADDMGLGKTLQVACVLALASRSARTRSPEVGPHLVIAPKILLDAWRREIERYFKPRALTVRIVEGADLREGSGSLVDEQGRLRVRALQEHDVWITNYDTIQARIRSLAADWHVVVLDEAQHIKNPGTAGSRNARALRKRFGIASTGTPVENALADVFAIGDFAFQGVLAANVREFEQRFPQRDPRGIDDLRARMAFGQDVRSCVLRRDKRDTLAHLLRGKFFHVEKMPMAPRQFETEQRIERMARARKGAMMQAIQELRKLYQHPLLLERGDQGDQAAVDTLVAESPKLAWLRSKLRQLAALDEKVLIFTESHRMQRILRCLLAADYPEVMAGRNIVINGDPRNVKTAHARIDAFSAVPGFDCLILSPTAAGTGLTITAANHVIHYGRWWNPAREDQATDRAYRIGQKKDVHVWLPILHHPGDPSAGFDVRLETLMQAKRNVAEDFLAPPMVDVSPDEFEGLFAE